jgi:hypothetical protein
VARGGRRPAVQCATFTGTMPVPVFELFLIVFEWYWYLVFESGIFGTWLFSEDSL